jgi:REP element-mobilizing transposase RayT
MPFRKLVGRPIAHLITRGVERRWIFESEPEKHRLLSLINDGATKQQVQILAYVIMSNHLHMIATGDAPAISRMMKRVNHGYAVAYNKAHQRGGVLFEGRFKSFLIRTPGWLLDRTRYIHFNPVAAGICGSAEAYPWSSFHAYLGQGKQAPWLDPIPVLSLLSSDMDSARERYAAFVSESPRTGQSERGDGDFIDEPQVDSSATLQSVSMLPALA